MTLNINCIGRSGDRAGWYWSEGETLLCDGNEKSVPKNHIYGYSGERKSGDSNFGLRTSEWKE